MTGKQAQRRRYAQLLSLVRNETRVLPVKHGTAMGADSATAMAAVAGLFAAALAHPVLDVLAGQPTFFAAHKADALALFSFAAAVTMLPAAVGALAARVAIRLGRRTAVGALVGIAAAPIVYRIGRQLAEIGDLRLIAFCTAVAAVLAVGHARSSMVRFIVATVGCAGLVLVPSYFLVRTVPVVAAANSRPKTSAPSPVIEHPAPIVFVVFDALRLVELLGDDGRIDEASFPNFARLSREATWYRNTTTVNGFTAQAVPALLTGNYPATSNANKGSNAPTLANYPINLFTILAETYDVVAEQTVTDLCPMYVCKQREARRRIVAGMLSDAMALLPRIFGTRHYVATLPPLEHNWKDFRSAANDTEAGEAGVPGRLEVAVPWIESLEAATGPRLYFLHTLIPHKPFRYTPDGLKYRAPQTRLRPATINGGFEWAADSATVRFEHARYRFQVAAVDRLLGRLVSRLEELGIYRDTLLVVTSDHGVGFRPRKSHRHYDESIQAELLFVPLFIKAPGQFRGEADDRPAQTIDILPTVLDLIGARAAETDGRSLLDAPPAHHERGFVVAGRRTRIAVADAGPLSLPPRAEREAKEMRSDAGTIAPVRHGSASASASAAKVVVLPPTTAVAKDGVTTKPRRAYFVHGFVIPEDPSAGIPEVAIKVGDEPALLAGTFLGSELGRVVFEGIVESPQSPAEVQRTTEVGIHRPGTDEPVSPIPPVIERPTTKADAYRTVDNAFWYAFWQGHPASLACSDRYRRAFLSAWRQPLTDPAGAHSLRRLIHDTASVCIEDEASAAASHGEAESACRCRALESAFSSPAGPGESRAEATSQNSVVWDTQWNGFTFTAECNARVKAFFTDVYVPSEPQTWVRPPFMLLRAAIERCRYEAAQSTGEDRDSCDCFSFDWADSYDAHWARRWRYSDPVKGPAAAAGFAILDASALIGEGPHR